MGILLITLLVIVLIHYDLPAFSQARSDRATQIRLLSGSELLFNDGRAAYWQKRYRDAIRMLRQAALISPERALTHCYLGLSLTALGNFVEAEKAYQEALRRNPQHSLAQSSLCELYSIVRKHPATGSLTSRAARS
jgi:tetratricopeptide (TPR) repeat protein